MKQKTITPPLQVKWLVPEDFLHVKNPICQLGFVCIVYIYIFQIQNCISKFNNIQIQQNQTSVDDAAAELSNIFISAATMSLKRRFKKITDKPKKKMV
jgi:hypothetical protein